MPVPGGGPGVERSKERSEVFKRASHELQPAQPLPELSQTHRSFSDFVIDPPDRPVDALLGDADLEPADVHRVANPLKRNPTLELVPGQGRPQDLKHKKVEEQVPVGSVAVGRGPTVVAVQQ